MNNMEAIIQAIMVKGSEALGEINSIAPQAVDYQEKLLARLLDENKDTEYGKKHGFAEIADYESYRQQISLTSYEDYREYVDRIVQKGEQNLLTAPEVVQFCMTTGTTGPAKLIPVVKEAKDLITNSIVASSLTRCAKELQEAGRGSFLQGKCLLLIEIGKLSYSESGIPIGAISGTAIRQSSDFLEQFATTPREVVSPDAYLDSKYLNLLFALKEPNVTWILSCYMTAVSGLLNEMTLRWESLCNDIETGTINPDVEMSAATREALQAKLTPDPERAAQLREIFAGGFSEPIVKKIWPNMKSIGAIGTGAFTIHTQMVRRFIGTDVPICHIGVLASESVMAVADGFDSDEFILLPQAGFFEFIPEGASGESEIYTMKDVEVGKRYELVLTTLSGFYRYRIKDVVEISGFCGQIPKIRFGCRSNVFIDIAGEKTTESHLLQSISEFSEKTGIVVKDYAAYADMDTAPGHYTVLVEPDSEVDMSRLPEYEAVMEEALHYNFGYKYERRANFIDPAKLLIQQRETHQLYHEMLVMKGANRNQLKPVRMLDTPQKKAFFTGMIEK